MSTTIIQCQFINNVAYSFGGAIYVLRTNPFISVFDSHFINNIAMTEEGEPYTPMDNMLTSHSLHQHSTTTLPPIAVCWMWITITTSVLT